jgi:hypothetical protein
VIPMSSSKSATFFADFCRIHSIIFQEVPYQGNRTAMYICEGYS